MRSVLYVVRNYEAWDYTTIVLKSIERRNFCWHYIEVDFFVAII